MKIIKYNDFIKENNKPMPESKTTYDYGCVMLYFNAPKFNKIHSIIKQEDIYVEYGLEKEPHITLLYGLHSDELDDDVVMDKLKGLVFEPVLLINPSLFNSSEYDVLKMDIKPSNAILTANKRLSELPHTTNYPEYHPHSTIAYIRQGMAKKYIDIINNDLKLNEMMVYPDRIVYSKPDGSKIISSIS